MESEQDHDNTAGPYRGGAAGSECAGPRKTVKDRRPSSSAAPPMWADADVDDPCADPGALAPGRGLRTTTNERPVSCGGGLAGAAATSLSLIRRFFLRLYQCFFFGCSPAPPPSTIVSARTCRRSGGPMASPFDAPPAAAATAAAAEAAASGGAFSMIAVWLFVRTCAGGIAPGGRPRAALATDGVGGGESSATDGFASELGPRGRSTDGNVCVEPDAIAYGES